MDDLPAVEIRQSVQHALRDLAQHLLAGPTAELFDLLVDTVQATTFAELHRNRDGPRRLVHERSVVLADVIRGTVLVEI